MSSNSAGENEAVRQAVGRPPISNRGLRILSMDGGGMKVGEPHSTTHHRLLFIDAATSLRTVNILDLCVW